MSKHQHTRSNSAPAYYLGRPADLWIAALQRPRATRHRDVAHPGLDSGEQSS